MKIIPQISTTNIVYINHKINLKRGYICFGNKRCEVKLHHFPELVDDEILISINVINHLNIPLFCNYDIKILENKIIIGPHIGMLSVKSNSDLDQMIYSYKYYLYDYKHIGGCVAVFSLEGIDKKSEVIYGYIYNPYTNEFEKGTCAFPSAIFKRIATGKKWYEYFEKMTNGRIFNDPLLGKWKIHNLLKTHEELVTYLPETIIYKRPKDVRQMLTIYPDIFLKPIYGSLGRDIINFKKRGNWTLATFSHSGEKYVLKNDYEVNEFLHQYILPHRYIAQQSVNLLTHNDHKIDFRIITVKGEDGRWNVPCITTSFGTSGNIISNISSGGTATLVYDTLKEILKLSEKEIYQLINKMKQIAIDIGECLCNQGYQYGNLGLDVALDINTHIWIIEVNNKNPDHTIAINAENPRLFYEARLSNMLYAKYLCGFGKDMNHETDIY